jgi:hypothetical protein
MTDVSPDFSFLNPYADEHALTIGCVPEPQPRRSEMKISLDLFLHVNRDLTSFQRNAIMLVFGPEKGNTSESSDTVSAITLISKQIDLLEAAGWTPQRGTGDMVTRPEHYDRFPIEPTFFIIENDIDWLRGNFLKYVCRYPFKNGIEDLRKAMRNLAMRVRHLDGDPSWSR